MKGRNVVVAVFSAIVLALRFAPQKSWLIAVGLPAVGFWLFSATRHPKEPKHNFGGTATEAELAYTDYLTSGGPAHSNQLLVGSDRGFELRPIAK